MIAFLISKGAHPNFEDRGRCALLMRAAKNLDVKPFTLVFRILPYRADLPTRETAQMMSLKLRNCT